MTSCSTAITDVRVFDGDGLSELRTVAVSDGRISENVNAEFTVDGRGGTLLPGLIDSHIHLSGIENLEQAAYWGVTTMLDMGTPSPKLVASLRGRPGLTDIRSSQSPASAVGGMQTTRMGMPAPSAVAGPDDAERFVAERAAEGADYIKIIIEDPRIMGAAALDGPTISAIVHAAHDRNLRTIAHVTTTAAFQLGADAKLDVLTHAPLDAPIGPALVTQITVSGIITVPTLVMMKGTAERRKLPTGYGHAEFAVTEFHRASIPALAGTDANTAPGSPFQPKHGESLHEELGLLVAAGLTPVEALRSATTLPARYFDLEDRGAIKPGRRADLVLVEGDPTIDITATRSIQAIWIAGVRVR